MTKNTEYYLSLPYTMTVKWDSADSIFVAAIQEIPSCTAHGDTRDEALTMLQDNLEAWVENALESSIAIPEPKENSDLPSGKWLQRVPPSLHKKLSAIAESEGVSLNLFVTSVLAEAVGTRCSTPINPGTTLSEIYGYAHEPRESAREPWFTLNYEQAVFQSDLSPSIPLNAVFLHDLSQRLSPTTESKGVILRGNSKKEKEYRYVA
jgi:antitoxin HicB